MKILNWNMNGLGARGEAIKRLSQELCPDVMCFQKERAKGSSYEKKSDILTDVFDTINSPILLEIELPKEL